MVAVCAIGAPPTRTRRVCVVLLGVLAVAPALRVAPASAVGSGAETIPARTCNRNDGFKQLEFFVGTEELSSHRGSTAQDGQDMLIASMFGNRTGGFFVDLAANDAVKISNTFVLERSFQWDGICIEANPFYLWKLAKRRCKIAAAVVTDQADDNVSFALRVGIDGGLGGIVSERKGAVKNYNHGTDPNAIKARAQATTFRTTTLLSIFTRLRAPTSIDYLSLDIEGAEFLALREFPFDQYSIAALTVERPSRDLRALLFARGYLFMWCLTTYGDTLFVHRSNLEVPGRAAEFRAALAAWQAHPRRQKCWLNRRIPAAPSAEQRFPGIEYTR